MMYKDEMLLKPTGKQVCTTKAKAMAGEDMTIFDLQDHDCIVPNCHVALSSFHKLYVIDICASF